MAVSSLGDTEPVLPVSTGVFSGSQTKVRSKVLGSRKSFEIANFSKYRESGRGFDTDEAGKFTVIVFNSSVYFKRLSLLSSSSILVPFISSTASANGHLLVSGFLPYLASF